MKKTLYQCLMIGVICCLAYPLAAARITVEGNLTQEEVVKPGQKVEGAITVRNNGDALATVKVYQNDYRFFADGRNFYDEPNTTPRSNAGWMIISPRQQTIAPHDKASFFYTMMVPPEDPANKMTGTFWSMVMVEPVEEEMLAPDTKTGKVSVGIKTVIRYAIQLVSQIGDTGARKLKFGTKQVIIQGDKRLLQVDVENTGERSMAPTMTIELFDAKGASAGKFDAGKTRIYPGCSTRFSTDVSKLDPGRYSALIVADNGDDYIFGSQAKITIPDPNAPPAAPVTPPALPAEPKLIDSPAPPAP